MPRSIPAEPTRVLHPLIVFCFERLFSLSCLPTNFHLKYKFVCRICLVFDPNTSQLTGSRHLSGFGYPILKSFDIIAWSWSVVYRNLKNRIITFYFYLCVVINNTKYVFIVANKTVIEINENYTDAEALEIQSEWLFVISRQQCSGKMLLLLICTCVRLSDYEWTISFMDTFLANKLPTETILSIIQIFS